MREVQMKEPARMALCILVLMNVHKRRLHEAKRQHQIHQDGDTGPHINIVQFWGPEPPEVMVEKDFACLDRSD